MRITAIEELVIRRKRRYKSYWRDYSGWHWLWKLFKEMVELVGALLGIHKHTASNELKQIAAICMNWMEKRAKI